MRHPGFLIVLGVLLLVLAVGCGTPAPAAESTPAVTPPATVGNVGILPPTFATEPADRGTSSVVVEVGPPPVPTDDCENPAGLYCQPFAPAGLDNCAEMNWWRVQAGVPARWGDEPRTGPKRQQGIGWRESNCTNTANSRLSAGCCFGYWQVASSNITAPGYAAAGVFSNCGVTSKWDYWGDAPLQKQKGACVVANLIAYHVALGEDPAWEAWDKWL